VLEKGKISSRQAILLMVTVNIATVILAVPAITVKHARQDAWISVILATGAGLLIALLVTALGLRFPRENIFQYPARILGRWPGNLVGLLYVAWFLHINAGVIREYGEFLVTVFMPDTPLLVFNLVVVAIAAYTVRNGLEVFTRVNEIFLPLVIGLMLISTFLVSKEINLQRLLPVADVGAVQMIKGALVPLAWFGEIVTIAVIIPYLNKPQESCRVAVTAILISGSVFIIVVLQAIVLFGPDLLEAFIFPGMTKYRIINVANFLGRLEALVMTAWVTAGFVKIATFYWVIVLGSAQIFRLQDYRPLVLPVGALLLAFSILNHPSSMDLHNFVARVFPFFALTFEIAIPLLLLMVALIRRKEEELE
jgi:spore germination protein KB